MERFVWKSKDPYELEYILWNIMENLKYMCVKKQWDVIKAFSLFYIIFLFVKNNMRLRNENRNKFVEKKKINELCGSTKRLFL